MSENIGPEGLISREDIAVLAPLFDRSEHAFDPTSRGAKLAEAELENGIKKLYQSKVLKTFPGVSETIFRDWVRNKCRLFLFKNG